MIPADIDAILREYGRLASHYDRRWQFYIKRTAGETLKRLDITPGESLLDVGCGTGVLLEAIARSVPDTVLSGADPSDDMLEIAHKRLGQVAHLKQGQAESLPFPDAAFDIVVSTSAFHYFRNPLCALKEMARVLRPTGHVVITDWCDDYISCRLCNLWLHFFDRAHFRTYGQKECRALIKQAGFTDVRVDRYKINWLWGLMTATARKYSTLIALHHDMEGI